MLPGGLTRIASAELEIASMQRGGSSADTWVLTEGEVDPTSLLHYDQPAVEIAHRSRSVTSRAAENLFWLGRYTERTREHHAAGAPRRSKASMARTSRRSRCWPG